MIKYLIILAFVAMITACVANRRGGYIGDFIQLFAVQTTLLNTTGNDLSPEMKIFYDKALLYAAQAQLVHHQFGQKRPIPKNGGKQIEFRKFTPLAKALTPLTEGVTPAGNQLDVTSLIATVSQYGDFISLSDVLELTAIDNVVLETTKLLGDQAGLTMDTVVRDILHTGTNVMYAPKLAAGPGSAETAVTSRANLNATAVLTVDLVKQVVARLRAVNAPKFDGRHYHAIIHPYAEYDIMNDPEWKYPHEYKDTENIYEGEIGMIAGVRFFESSEAKIWRGTGCPSGLSVFGTLFFGENAYGVTDVEGGGLETIVKQKGSAGTADPLNQRSSVGWKALETAEILMQPYMIRVEHCSSRWSATVEAN